jgi:hypothetical protein
MKKLAIILSMVAVIGFLASPVLAQSPRPSADQLIKSYYERQGEAVPQATWNYLFDLVTNAYSWGWGSTYVITNYNAILRIQVQGWVVPTGADPGDELYFSKWLNPYEVEYVNLTTVGLGDMNAWSIVWSTFTDFGAGVLLYNTTADQPGIAWEGGWYWTTP